LLLIGDSGDETMARFQGVFSDDIGSCYHCGVDGDDFFAVIGWMRNGKFQDCTTKGGNIH
jgi:hypothetical protein